LSGVLRVVLGDQLSTDIAALRDYGAGDVVLLAEVRGECTYVAHHGQKIVMVLAAMRHFAAGLRARGLRVEYVALDDPANTHCLRGEVARAVGRLGCGSVVCTEPGEFRVAEDMQSWHVAAGVPVEIRGDDRFFCSRQDFMQWAQGKRQLRQEFFYRDMRRRTGLLMEGREPAGGAWNYDAENRKKLPAGVKLPAPRRFAPDAITHAVMALVAAQFPDHFGTLDGFAWPVTAAQAQAALDDFITHRLAQFGDWQDAMKHGALVLFHARIGAALNIGLLDPRQVCGAVAAEYHAGRVPLNAAEGFIRQVLGWREYIRGIYWLHMPRYAQLNALQAERKLPWFYWTGETDMNCLRQSIAATRDHAYAHHIQRLMVTGNFALLAGIDPALVDEWYLVVYADAFEWVEMPNTRGMALFADGGIVGSKPYAASGAYINKMSDYCGNCIYDVKDATGERACPFNALYWDFIARHAGRFENNPRMAMPLRTLEKMAPARVGALRARAAQVLGALDRGERI